MMQKRYKRSLSRGQVPQERTRTRKVSGVACRAEGKPTSAANGTVRSGEIGNRRLRDRCNRFDYEAISNHSELEEGYRATSSPDDLQF